MSDQNFETISAFTSADQPLPIARQLGSQSYLSQIQDKRQNLVRDEEDVPPPEVQQRFSSHVHSEEIVSPPANKMDAFFRQAEEDERRRLHAEQNPAPSQPIVEVQADRSVEPGEAPAVELPQVAETPLPQVAETPIVDSVQPLQPQPQFAPAEKPPSEAPHNVGQHNTSPFSVSSFGSPSGNPAFGQHVQTPQPTSQPTSQTNAPAGIASPQISSPQPQDVELPLNQNLEQNQQRAAHTEDAPQVQNTVGRLTGTAGLSAAMAVAGVNAMATQLAGQTTSESGSHIPQQPAPAPIQMNDPSELLRQQHFIQQPAAMPSQELGNPSISEFSSPAALQTPSPATGGEGSGGFAPATPTPPQPVLPTSPAQQPQQPQQPQPVAAPVASSIQQPALDEGEEDARLAAMQQAQRIKAERAKALADATPVPARPFGASVQTQDSPTSPASETAPTHLPPAVFPENVRSVEKAAPPAVEPQRRAAVGSQPTAEISSTGSAGATDSAPKRRPFPMALFNRHLLKNLRSGVVFVDHQRRVQLWSKGAEAMTGIISEAVMDRPLYPQTFNLRFDDSTGVSLEQCPIAQCLETMQNFSGDYRILNAANQEVKVEITIAPVIDENRYVNGAIVIFDDHSVEIDLQRQLKDLYEFSVLDPLTQVANRAEFERVLEEYVRAFNQSDSFNCSIIICDIDYFKSINDKFGHAVGDQALVAFAEMLKTYVRSQDLVARYGGEEFVILCADCDTDSALQRAEQIRMALFKTQQPMLDGKAISASFGVSELRQGDTAMEFFVRADTALLKAKELGRNRVVIADQREATRDVGVGEDGSISGMQWRQQRREHTALVCEEYKTSTPVPVLVEKLRGFIIEKDAWLQRVDQEFLSMEVDFEDPRDYSRKGSFTLNIEFKEGEENAGGEARRQTFIRITIFPGRKKKWFSTNHTDVAPYLLSELRSYLMINDEASHLSVKLATENVRGKESSGH